MRDLCVDENHQCLGISFRTVVVSSGFLLA